MFKNRDLLRFRRRCGSKRSMVQRFTVDCILLFVLFKIIDKSSYCRICSSCLLIYIFKYFLWYIFYVWCKLQFTLEFGIQAFYISQEPNKRWICLEIKSLPNVMHCWSNRILYLFFRLIVFTRKVSLSDHKFTSESFDPEALDRLPGFNVYKSINSNILLVFVFSFNRWTLEPWTPETGSSIN